LSGINVYVCVHCCFLNHFWIGRILFTAAFDNICKTNIHYLKFILLASQFLFFVYVNLFLDVQKHSKDGWILNVPLSHRQLHIQQLLSLNTFMYIQNVLTVTSVWLFNDQWYNLSFILWYLYWPLPCIENFCVQLLSVY